jgi:hypothetical protein
MVEGRPPGRLQRPDRKLEIENSEIKWIRRLKFFKAFSDQ